MADPLPDHQIQDAWSAFEQVRNEAFVAKPSMPVLFFGDLKAYLHPSNRLRTITVGINPSSAEFPEPDAFRRFRGAESLPSRMGRIDRPLKEVYVQALSSYFQNCPYDWFGSFDALFSGMDCSFYGGAAITALHTDLCSPIATQPKWSKLSKGQKEMLTRTGIPLWRSLFSFLNPRIVIFAVNPFPTYDVSGWKAVSTIVYKKDGKKRERPYDLKHHYESSIDTHFFHGPAMNIPFGGLTDDDKRKLGGDIRTAVSSTKTKA